MVLMLLLGAATLTATSGRLSGSGAERFVGTDGTSVTLARDGTQVAQIEIGHYRGAGVRAANHPAFLFAAGLDDDPGRTLIMERRLGAPGATGAVTVERLQELGPAGLSTLAEVSGNTFIVRSPALIEVPANSEPGQTWTQTGTTRAPGDKNPRPWSTTGTIRAAADGCLSVTLTGTRDGAKPVTTTEIRCPRRGVVATSSLSKAREDPNASAPPAPSTAPLAFAGPLEAAAPRREQITQSGSPAVVTSIAGVVPTSTGVVVHSMLGELHRL